MRILASAFFLGLAHAPLAYSDQIPISALRVSANAKIVQCTVSAATLTKDAHEHPITGDRMEEMEHCKLAAKEEADKDYEAALKEVRIKPEAVPLFEAWYAAWLAELMSISPGQEALRDREAKHEKVKELWNRFEASWKS